MTHERKLLCGQNVLDNLVQKVGTKAGGFYGLFLEKYLVENEFRGIITNVKMACIVKVEI